MGENDPINITRMVDSVKSKFPKSNLGIEHAIQLLLQTFDIRRALSSEYHISYATVALRSNLNRRV